MMKTIDDLRAIAQCCQVGKPLSEELAQWLAGSLEDFLSQRVQSIDEALGLRAARGGVPWWREETMRRRDDLLRGFAQQHFSELSVCAKARKIRLLTLRYCASAWRFDRERADLPEAYRGTEREWVWRIFKAGAPMPIGERHLRTILATGKSGRPKTVSHAGGSIGREFEPDGERPPAA